MADTQFKVENYLANSFVIVEGKKNADFFYIILKGRVKLAKENPVVTEQPYSVLGPGDFFGVVSCMSGHSRIETAVALENVSLISVERDKFGLLIQKNPTVAMKIIRFFSRKLRDFDQAIIRAYNTTGKTVLFTGLSLTASVIYWCFFPMKFQAQMAQLLVILLAFHLIGALMFIPPLVSLLRPKFALQYADDHDRRILEEGIVDDQAAAGA